MVSYLYDPRPERSAQAAWRRREARRQMYARRRIAALAILLVLVTSLVYGGYTLLSWWQSERPGPTSETADAGETGAPLPFTPAYSLNIADLDNDGQVERVAVSQSEGDMREVALVTGPAEKPQMIGAALRQPDAPLTVEDLPRAKQVLVWSGHLPRRGEPAEVSIGGAKALEAAGGEPDRKAWRLDPAQGLVPVDYYTLAAPVTPPEPTVILVDKGLNVLWFYVDGELVQTARVATGIHLDGPPISAANKMTNFLTPTGRFPISLAVPGMTYHKENIPAGDPENPLGSRWLGFHAFEGDDGTIWAIHGTNDPSRLGRYVTTGSIEMRNEEIEQLFEQVAVGTPIIIQNGLASEGT